MKKLCLKIYSFFLICITIFSLIYSPFFLTWFHIHPEKNHDDVSGSHFHSHSELNKKQNNNNYVHFCEEDLDHLLSYSVNIDLIIVKSNYPVNSENNPGSENLFLVYLNIYKSKIPDEPEYYLKFPISTNSSANSAELVLTASNLSPPSC